MNGTVYVTACSCCIWPRISCSYTRFSIRLPTVDQFEGTRSIVRLVLAQHISMSVGKVKSGKGLFIVPLYHTQ